MEIRRLHPDTDRALYETAFGWERDYPRWLRDAEKSCGVGLDEWLARSDHADIGVFDPHFIGMVSVNHRGPQVFEGHVWAARGTALDTLADAVIAIRNSLAADFAMRAFFVWVVKNNRPIKRLCAMIGCVLDSATMIDGESHGRPIEWQRMVWVRPDLTS